MRSRSLTSAAAGLALALACFAAPLQAMTFTLIEPVDLPGDGMRPTHLILGSGPIQPGDAAAFAAFMAQLPPTDHYDGVQWGIALDSPGGNLQEGVRLGEAFRAHVVTTVVLNGQACESACAVAYLGGAAMYATALGVQRLLQPGGRLGYHGIAVAEGAVAVANETLELARTTNAVIRDYAIRMGVGDDGLVQSLFNTPAEDMEYVDTPAEILGLQVTLAVDVLRPPPDWAVNVCRHAVGDMLETLDPLGLAERVAGRPEPIGSIEDFRMRLLAAKHNDGTGLGTELYAALARAPAPTALGLLAGGALFVDETGGEIWELGLGRGSGFYYDTCFAATGFLSLYAVVVDGVSEIAQVESYGMLHGFPADQPLW